MRRKIAKRPNPPVSYLPTPPNKTQADSQEPLEPPKPPANCSLWQKVKYTMDKEDFFRQKSKSAEIQIKRLNREVDSLKNQLRRQDETMDAEEHRIYTLTEALKEAEQRAEQEARRRDESSKHLNQKLQGSQRESKRYRTALAAAFKLIDDLKDKTTLAELLAQTDQQLLNGAPKQEPETSAAASPEDSSDEDYIRRPVRRKYPQRGMATPRRPVKREREGEWSSEDSDERPLAKARKLGNRILRNITPDE
ncbi:hypothetical protein H634G_00248 [Metarhizium anisopliae BRIP 53293]|uniref:Uncharacterized protein n=1 Tax=Metarhizium anisopliae BRIP 53293 TaxID=1291518 RepID=A0A0D9PGD0_METAN|nr:hypothetical protein H634G_00248 [Metarhizium anisopliae BRIP 53293]KJK86802.1 hypothetical protein H633G_09327 [Metarhizium anisopliae BRIP 53284]